MNCENSRQKVVSSVDDSLSMHDFRVVKGFTHSNLIFDVVIPHHCKKSDSEVIDEITQKIKEKDKSLFTVITDRSFLYLNSLLPIYLRELR
jgi:hypothetical protein